MKLAAFFMFAACIQVSAKGYSQDVTLSVTNAPMAEVFHQIYRQTGYVFFYNDPQLDKTHKVTFSVSKMPLKDILGLSFKNQPITYEIVGKTIVVRDKADAVTEAALTDVRQNIEVHGRVTDEAGRPVSTVSVIIPGTPLGTMTNRNGEYVLKNVPEDADLIFSYVGYEAQRISIKGRTEINIVLKSFTNTLNDVALISKGYYTTTKALNTGSVSIVKAEDIANQPVGNVLDALQGRMAGVQVTQSNGLPGSGVTIQIRGQVSLNSGTMPLYIIDGVPFDFYNGNSAPPTDNLNSYGIIAANGGISPFTSINPADIESIEVLKDADATAIYGARGSNGVILITTKKGKAGKTKVNINAYSGIGKVGHYIDMLNGDQYLALRKEAFAHDSVTPTTTNAPDLTLWSQNDFTDWQKTLIGGTSHISDVGVTLSGGNQTTNFAFSPDYHHESTVYPGSFAENRLSGRLNVEHHSLDNRFFATISANYSYDRTNLPTADLSSYYNLPPNYSPINADGSLYWVSGITNPYAALRQPYYGITTNFGSALNLKYVLMKGLDIRLNGGYTTIELNQQRQLPSSTVNPLTTAVVSSASFADNNGRSYIVEPQIDFKHDMGKKGTVDALVGTTFQRNLMQGYIVNGTNYTNDALLGSMPAAGTLSATQTYDLYKYTSIYGRLNYTWDNKYIINGTMRRDGSSRFGPGKQFGTFGAVGAAWVFSKEKFIKNALPFLSFGKLRGSWGVTGNDQIQNYQFLSTYTTSGGTATYQGTPVQRPTRLANDQIHWESNKKLETALELGFFKDRVSLTADYYRNLTGNQLLYISTPAQTGFTSYFGNFPATIETKGFELELTSDNIQGKDFKWQTAFNITFGRNKLLGFENLSGNSYYKNSYLVGYPVPLTRLYVFNGIDPSTGIITYKTSNANGLPTYVTDQIPADIGHPFYGGLNNSFSYKKFTLGFFLQFSHKKGYTNSISAPPGSTYSTLGSIGNQNTTTLDHWTQPGDRTEFGIPTTTANKTAYNAYSFYYNSSTAFYGDASWLKLRNINLSYTLPDKWVKSISFSSIKIYAEGQNVVSFSGYKNAYDPETGTAMPPLRTIVIGINASL